MRDLCPGESTDGSIQNYFGIFDLILCRKDPWSWGPFSLSLLERENGSLNVGRLLFYIVSRETSEEKVGLRLKVWKFSSSVFKVLITKIIMKEFSGQTRKKISDKKVIFYHFIEYTNDTKP